MNDEPDDNPGVVIFPPLLFVICFVAGMLAYLMRPSRFALPLGFRGLGCALTVAAVVLSIWAQRTMRTAGTNIRPDQPATVIVSNGPFAFTRNPLYLSVLAMFGGIGVALASKTFLAILVPLFLVLRYGVVGREERYLEGKFGDTYRTYKARVRRWV
jgi:protein-S-isoprenylcysteine O-methyltransferase Ste14